MLGEVKPKSSRLEDQEIVAIKKIDKIGMQQKQPLIDNLINEIKVHWSLIKCTSAVRLLQMFEDSKSFYMILEYQPKGTLMNVMTKLKSCFSEAQARVIVE